MKQGKEILVAHVGKYVLVYYVDNLDQFKNTIGAENKKKNKYEEFNKWMAYI